VALQNRVTPFGELIATPARGTMFGNRGGHFHRDDRTLGKRRWARANGSVACCNSNIVDTMFGAEVTPTCSSLMK
jgi:hypothetical protein